MGGNASRSGDEVQIAMFEDMSKIEGALGDRAKHALEGMGRGPAAELVGRMVDQGGKIRNPDGYVIRAAKEEAACRWTE